MGLTRSIVDYALYQQQLILEHATELDIPEEAVYYGDQTAFPYSPSVTVEIDEKQVSYESVQRGTGIAFVVYVTIYSGLIDAESINTLEADRLAEKIEDIINQDPTCGGLTLDNLVVLTESSYAQRDNTVYRITRLTLNGRSKHRLPAATWNG